jgi:hypothetical protein
MKGIVFTKLNEFVEELWGLEFWDEILQQSKLASGGAYTTVEYYNDQEMFTLIENISAKKNISGSEAQIAFGRWLFKELYLAAPPDVHQFKDVFSFLHGVQNVIHVEVKKLNPDVLLPEFDFISETATEMQFRYRSPRNMCHFCEGLIYGLAEHTNQKVEVTHCKCVHVGDDECILKVKKVT